MEGIYNFLQNNAIYIVMIIVLMVWAGIFFYMLALDKRIKNVEKEKSADRQARSRIASPDHQFWRSQAVLRRLKFHNSNAKCG